MTVKKDSLLTNTFIVCLLAVFCCILWGSAFPCIKLGFAGVIIINLSDGGISADMSLLGEGFVLLSAVSYAFSSCCIKIFSKNENPVLLSGWQFTVGGIIMIIIGYFSGGKLTPSGTSSYILLLYMAFISAAAYSLWGVLLKYNFVSKVSVFGFANPVFGVILSALILGESGDAFGARSLIALALITAGIIVVNINQLSLIHFRAE